MGMATMSKITATLLPGGIFRDTVCSLDAKSSAVR